MPPKKSTIRAPSNSSRRSSSARSNQSRASSVGSSASRGSSRGRRRPAVRKATSRIGSKVNAELMEALRIINPLSDDLHTYQGAAASYAFDTVKAKQVGTVDIPSVGGVNGFVFVNSTRAQTQTLALTPCVGVWTNSGASLPIFPTVTFDSNTTTATYESIRRVSCAMILTYTGRADACSGIVRIGKGPMVAAFNTPFELGVGGVATSIATSLGQDEDSVSLPLSALLNKPLVLVPRPMSQEAERFREGNGSALAVPFFQVAGEEIPGWEEIWVTVTGYDTTCTFNVQWVEIVEAYVGSQSIFKSFATPATKLALPWNARDSHMMTYSKALAAAVGSDANVAMAKNFIYTLGTQLAHRAGSAMASLL
jgi:hypothetical protein